MKTELTIEQSQRLIERGVNPIFASGLAKDPVSQWELPVFTLIDIAKLLPERKAFADAEAYLNIHFELAGHKWVAQYLDYDKDDDVIGEESAPELIDALYSLCLWGIKRGYVEILKKD